MTFTPAELLDFLAKLHQEGVGHFEGFDIKVSFSLPPAEVGYPTVSRPSVTHPKSIWDDPSLWPQGEPPKFPTKPGG